MLPSGDLNLMGALTYCPLCGQGQSTYCNAISCHIFPQSLQHIYKLVILVIQNQHWQNRYVIITVFCQKESVLAHFKHKPTQKQTKTISLVRVIQVNSLNLSIDKVYQQRIFVELLFTSQQKLLNEHTLLTAFVGGIGSK